MNVSYNQRLYYMIEYVLLGSWISFHYFNLKQWRLPEEWYWSNKLSQATYSTTYAQKSKIIISRTERIRMVILAYIIGAHSVLLRILASNQPPIFFFLQVRLCTAHCISIYQPLCCNYVSFNWFCRKMLK